MPRKVKGTATHVPTENEKVGLRNFKEMTEEEHKAIASKGGKAAAESKRYNESFKQAVQWG